MLFSDSLLLLPRSSFELYAINNDSSLLRLAFFEFMATATHSYFFLFLVCFMNQSNVTARCHLKKAKIVIHWNQSSIINDVSFVSTASREEDLLTPQLLHCFVTRKAWEGSKYPLRGCIIFIRTQSAQPLLSGTTKQAGWTETNDDNDPSPGTG